MTFTAKSSVVLWRICLVATALLFALMLHTINRKLDGISMDLLSIGTEQHIKQ